MGAHRLEVLEDADAVHRRGAEVLAGAVRGAIDERDQSAIAVSGGSDPWPMFSQLEDLIEDWTKVAVYQVDERVAPPGSDERNLTHLIESLSIGAQGSIRPMPVNDDDLDAAADRYAESLPGDGLDIAHLGIGPDGHTASLVPGDPVLDVTDRRVAVTSGEYQGVRRMTLTYPEIERVRKLLWVVTGEEKVDALRKLIDEDPSTPSGRVRPGGESLILADRAAAPDS
jgi:6-phosphogluconolactonase